jgi:hypothetical protein
MVDHGFGESWRWELRYTVVVVVVESSRDFGSPKKFTSERGNRNQIKSIWPIIDSYLFIYFSTPQK